MGRGTGPPMVDVKIVMVGDVSVGKTSIATRFTSEEFKEDVRTTLGSTCLFKEMDVNGRRVKYSVWDTAGQEVYHSMVPVYFRQSAAVVLTYDVTKPETLEGAKKWVVQVEEHAPSNVIIALVGNKSDLPQTVDHSHASSFAASKNMLHFVVSAKSGDNITQLFTDIFTTFAESNPEAVNVRGSTTGTVNLAAPAGERSQKSCPC
eukprot:Rhum_TRINITY_DN1171_c0_g1::Rhum_TRINITY_DN1171_c0_g1_i1::g.3559::m.3559